MTLSPPGAGSLFERSTTQIEAAYQALGHSLGWRFLYSPGATLAPGTRLMFAGLNPGGGRYEPPLASVEEGNAYRVERWGPGGTLNPLQKQIRALYDRLVALLPIHGSERLMDQTLAVNFCPFRSPSWEALPHKKESLAFSIDLWRQMLPEVRPSVILCLTPVPFGGFRTVLEEMGGQQVRQALIPVGWGAVHYEESLYQVSGHSVLLVRLPHLSRFRIFGRPASEEAARRLTAEIAAHLT